MGKDSRLKAELYTLKRRESATPLTLTGPQGIATILQCCCQGVRFWIVGCEWGMGAGRGGGGNGRCGLLGLCGGPL